MSVPKKKEKKKDMFICSDIIVGFSQAGQLYARCAQGLVGIALFPLHRQKGMSGCGVYLLIRLPRHWAYYVGGPKPS